MKVGPIPELRTYTMVAFAYNPVVTIMINGCFLCLPTQFTVMGYAISTCMTNSPIELL